MQKKQNYFIRIIMIFFLFPALVFGLAEPREEESEAQSPEVSFTERVKSFLSENLWVLLPVVGGTGCAGLLLRHSLLRAGAGGAQTNGDLTPPFPPHHEKKRPGTDIKKNKKKKVRLEDPVPVKKEEPVVVTLISTPDANKGEEEDVTTLYEEPSNFSALNGGGYDSVLFDDLPQDNNSRITGFNKPATPAEGLAREICKAALEGDCIEKKNRLINEILKLMGPDTPEDYKQGLGEMPAERLREIEQFLKTADREDSAYLIGKKTEQNQANAVDSSGGAVSRFLLSPQATEEINFVTKLIPWVGDAVDVATRQKFDELHEKINVSPGGMVDKDVRAQMGAVINIIKESVAREAMRSSPSGNTPENAAIKSIVLAENGKAGGLVMTVTFEENINPPHRYVVRGDLRI